MLLYYNGDSFAAGVELADEILPDYPGCHPLSLESETSDIRKRRREWVGNSKKPTHQLNKLKMSMINEIRKLELERAYPNLVHNMTGIPYINKSLGGSSMDRIVRVTIADLIKLKKDDPDRKLVAFICTTYMERSEMPNNLPPEIDMHGEPMDWASVSFNFRQYDHDQIIENIKRYKALFETTYHSMVNFYKNVILIQDYCKLNDVDLYWITARENIRREVDRRDEQYKDRTDLIALMDYANIEPAINMMDIANNELDGQDVLCPGGHFSQIVHDRTAEKIVDIIKGKNNV
jgi:hypothetical protein